MRRNFLIVVLLVGLCSVRFYYLPTLLIFQIQKGLFNALTISLVIIATSIWLNSYKTNLGANWKTFMVALIGFAFFIGSIYVDNYNLRNTLIENGAETYATILSKKVVNINMNRSLQTIGFYDCIVVFENQDNSKVNAKFGVSRSLHNELSKGDSIRIVYSKKYNKLVVLYSDVYHK